MGSVRLWPDPQLLRLCLVIHLTIPIVDTRGYTGKHSFWKRIKREENMNLWAS